jgi:hypothetical protein
LHEEGLSDTKLRNFLRIVAEDQWFVKRFGRRAAVDAEEQIQEQSEETGRGLPKAA